MKTGNSRRTPENLASAGGVVIRGPNRWNCGEVLIAALYWDHDQLINDYRRCASVKRRPGTTAQISTVALEKSPEGLPYVEIGRRWYTSRQRGDSRNYFEDPADRVTLPVRYGGRSRNSLAKKIQEAEELWLMFADFDPVRGEATYRDIIRGTLGHAKGTHLIPLTGVLIFGRLVRARAPPQR